MGSPPSPPSPWTLGLRRLRVCCRKDSSHWKACMVPKKRTLSYPSPASLEKLVLMGHWASLWPCITLAHVPHVAIDSWLDSHWCELRMQHTPKPHSSILPTDLFSSYNRDHSTRDPSQAPNLMEHWEIRADLDAPLASDMYLQLYGGYIYRNCSQGSHTQLIQSQI